MKTLKELADILKVDKDKIKYQYRKLDNIYKIKENNINYITEPGVEIITREIIGKVGNIDTKNSTPLEGNDNLLITTLQKEIEELKKDKISLNGTIDYLKNQNDNLIKLLDQQQQLNAITIKKLENLALEGKNTILEENNSNKDTFWNKIKKIFN